MPSTFLLYALFALSCICAQRTLGVVARISVGPVSVPTQAYFQAPFSPFTVVSTVPGWIALTKSLSSVAGVWQCSITVPSSSVGVERQVCVVRWRDAVECGVSTLAELTAMFVDALGSPPSPPSPKPALIILLNTTYPSAADAPGHPLYEPYVSTCPKGADWWINSGKGLPAEVVLVTSTNAEAVERAIGVPASASVLIENEFGPWNDVFLSKRFRATMILLMSLNAILFVTGLAQTIWSIVSTRTILFDLRNRIFLLATLATALLVPSLVLPVLNATSTALANIALWIHTLSFFLMLHLWHNFMLQIHERRHLTAFRIAVIVAAIAAFVSVVFATGIYFMPQHTRAIHKVLTPMRHVWAGANSLIALVFVLIAGQFYKRSSVDNITGRNRILLLRIFILCVLAAIALIALSSCDLVVVLGAVKDPIGLATVTITRAVARTMQAASLIIVLGASVPKPKKCTPLPWEATGRRRGKTNSMYPLTDETGLDSTFTVASEMSSWSEETTAPSTTEKKGSIWRFVNK